ncbi:hypothetical protein JP75_20600 [Devosia riboflavina]|uniref:Uncharacterized protein n=1 Tax=Devosia riboflavina TaxID=46914 RepID=A0A087LXX5_9HYPH|nr:hypothetical protein [Devosia riboflavina]KFL29478.1 hypothetical protein JP75_20600 [Devosia riboflavina]
MEQHSQVLTTEVEFDGNSYTATYFVEHGIIHANIDGRLVHAPLTQEEAQRTVQAMLTGHLLQTHRKSAQRDSWMDHA